MNASDLEAYRKWKTTRSAKGPEMTQTYVALQIMDEKKWTHETWYSQTVRNQADWFAYYSVEEYLRQLLEIDRKTDAVVGAE